MRKLVLMPLLLLCFSFSSRAIEKGDFMINTTINLGHHSFITGANTIKGLGYIPGFTLNMDYSVSDYFGFGGWFTFNAKKWGTDNQFRYRNLGVGVRGIFHLYQLISDKGNTSLDGDKLDIYIPLIIGGGFKLDDKNLPGDTFKGGAIVGSAIGVTYYFVEHIGANIEGGYCEGSYGKFGLSFKF